MRTRFHTFSLGKTTGFWRYFKKLQSNHIQQDNKTDILVVSLLLSRGNLNCKIQFEKGVIYSCRYFLFCTYYWEVITREWHTTRNQFTESVWYRKVSYPNYVILTSTSNGFHPWTGMVLCKLSHGSCKICQFFKKSFTCLPEGLLVCLLKGPESLSYS